MVAGWRDGEIRDIYREMLRLCMVVVGKTLFGADVAEKANEVCAAVETVLRELTGGMMQLPALLASYRRWGIFAFAVPYAGLINWSGG